MAIEINGTTGISGVDGSAGTPALQGSDTNTGISFGTDEVSINTGGTARATFDGAGRLLVGTSTAYGVSGLAVPNLQVSQNTDAGIGLFSWKADNVAFTPSVTFARSYNNTEGTQTALPDGAWLGVVRFSGSDGSAFKLGADIKAQADGQAWTTNDCPTRLVFSTTADGASSPTERMRLNSSGTLFIGATVDNPGDGNTSTGCVFRSTGKYFLSLQGDGGHLNRNTDGYILHNRRSGNFVGGMYLTSNSTSYNTSSDYRLKENVVDLNGAIDRVKRLAPKRFNFITDANTTVDGFLAHEAQTVVPEAVTGTHDQVDDDGNPVYQGIDQSKLVPLLTAALQEAIAKIETLEAKVAVLEAAS